MYAMDQIRRIHLELTTRCNAACPMCSRNERGGFEVDGLPLSELRLQDVQAILPHSFVRQLEQIWLCGNYGDPIIAHETIEIVSYLRQCNDRLRIGMNTNGSARTIEWWSRLGKVLEFCHFGVDGLADTNHLHRRQTNFEVILRNAQAYINAGGKATWEFIAFEHNEHQIEEAKKLACELGFERFRVRRTGRFYNNGQVQSELAVKAPDGEFAYFIKPPKNGAFRNSSVDKIQNSDPAKTNGKTYIDSTQISCKAAIQKEIYISAQGHIFPCCYIGSIHARKNSMGNQQISRLLEQHGGLDAIDGSKRPINEIVGSELFQSAIPQSWNKQSINEGRLAVCAANCGVHCASRGQYDAADGGASGIHLKKEI